MLCLSLVAARDLQAPFLEPPEVQTMFDTALDYFRRERDLRGFDPAKGWMHTPAHTADTLKFLARNPKLAAGQADRLLAAVAAKIESSDTVFVWGENDRMALALHAAVRRDDASPAALESWLARWVGDYNTLWTGGPQVNPRQFAAVENARQVLRSLHSALSMEQAPTSTGDTARKSVLATLARMR